MEKALFSINDFIKQLPKVEKQLLDDEIITKRLKKNEILFDNTKTDNRAYYVVQGLLRKFTLIEAKEITLDFFFRDEIYFPKTLDYKAPTATFLQALEDSVVFQINLERFNTIKSDAPNLANLELKILEMAYLQTINRLETFQTMNATERYVHLLNKSSNIVQHIPLIYVASYLGINNASLSKIRAALK